MNLQIVKQAMKDNRLQSSHVDWLIEQVEQAQDMERNYTHQLGEMARHCSAVIPWLVEAVDDDIFSRLPGKIREGIDEITDYVDAVRAGEGAEEIRWAVHIIGPDDVIPCRGEFDALRRANQHNISFAKLMADNPSPNDPYCVAVAEQI